MDENDLRFKTVGRWMSETHGNTYRIIVDTETGVHYLITQIPHGISITPLLGADGKVIISKDDI